jgi:nicotinamidase-related amidase
LHGAIRCLEPTEAGTVGAGFQDPAMSKNDELRYGAPGETTIHLCVDMQRMFAEDTDWNMPWLELVLPNIISITSTRPERTIFTRFIPARKPGQGVGMWRHYYERWGSMTIGQLGPEMIELVPDLAKFVPPARTFDKHVYSPWTGTDLHHQLGSEGIDTVIITGGETDVCVLATMLGAIDWGFRVILVTDALCSSADETHEAMMNVYMNRFGEQVETVTTKTLLQSWQGRRSAKSHELASNHPALAGLDGKSAYTAHSGAQQIECPDKRTANARHRQA